MSDMRSSPEQHGDDRNAVDLAPACGKVFIETPVFVELSDECACGCDAYEHRCARWVWQHNTNADAFDLPPHPCC